MSNNPLLKHPVLQHMPYTILHNPSIEGIKKFLLKRTKNMRIFKYFALAIFLSSLSMIILGISTSIEVYLIPIFMLFAIGWAHAEQRKCAMTDIEIKSLIDQHGANGS